MMTARARSDSTRSETEHISAFSKVYSIILTNTCCQKSTRGEPA